MQSYNIGTDLLSCKAISIRQKGELVTTAEANGKGTLLAQVGPGEVIGTIKAIKGSVNHTPGCPSTVIVERDGVEVKCHHNHFNPDSARLYKPNDTSIVEPVAKLQTREELLAEMKKEEEAAARRKAELEEALADLDVLEDEQEEYTDEELDVVVSS